MKLRNSRAARFAAALLIAPVALTPMLATPAHAIIVFDPSNYAQNVLTAARSLQQITNQITSLQNEAQMLINQARNLASLPYSSLQQLQQSVQRTQQLLQQAQNIAYDVQQIDRAFQQKYGNVSMSATDQQLITDARTRMASCRPASSATSTPTAPRCRRWSARARAQPARFRRRRPATSFSPCRPLIRSGSRDRLGRRAMAAECSAPPESVA